MKKKLISKLKNNKLYICSFFIALVVISILYKLNNVTPLGDRSLLCVDFYHQYGPMLGELFDRIQNGNNLILTTSLSTSFYFAYHIIPRRY